MPDNRVRIWFALFVLVIFCLGGAGGFILARHLPPFPEGPGARGGPAVGPGFGRGRGGGRGDSLPPFGRGPGARGPGGPAGLPPEVAGRLADQLELDEAQRTQFRKVLDDHRAKFEQVHREARERFDGEQRELQQAIRAILRPNQVQRFDEFVNGRRP